MDSIITSANLIPINNKITVEDVLNYSKVEIQAFLRANNVKISGSKLTLAQRVVDTIGSRCDIVSDCAPQSSSFGVETPEIAELRAGWTGTSCHFPTVKLSDIESYLLHSSHRTEDAEKMQCYRQYIRDLKFYKEGFIHKIMINSISDSSKHCYIRSKCYPSMQQGVYEQWILMTKENPLKLSWHTAHALRGTYIIIEDVYT
ncbi:hypothetical protein DPMN_162706 [Dreissena polymorpha]|uniref:SAP domain-containing protein n=1 Tax=Dreissena polymorpha TaxID=45954 RepID=A0A9D4ES55_DREPO|nr:hypothetical protein DPMN_162706 [Dreissena polymorpha]